MTLLIEHLTFRAHAAGQRAKFSGGAFEGDVGQVLACLVARAVGENLGLLAFYRGDVKKKELV